MATMPVNTRAAALQATQERNQFLNFTLRGESFAMVALRVLAGLDRLLNAHRPRTAVVVSHVTPIKTILQFALDGGPSILHRLHLDLAALSIAEFFPDGPASVRLVNQTTYLDDI